MHAVTPRGRRPLRGLIARTSDSQRSTPPAVADDGTGRTRKSGTDHAGDHVVAPRGPTALFQGFDDEILALYSRGLSVLDIEAHLEEIYGGRGLISKVSDAVMDDVRAWAARPLADVYPVIFLESLVLK